MTNPSIGRRTALRCSAAVALLVSARRSAQADAFPTRPITIVVPFPPGGVSDSLTRLVGAEMATRLGQPVVIENRSGGGGAIGTDAVVRARADGYTLVLSSTGTLAVLPAAVPRLSYDPSRDLTPIGQIYHSGMMIAARNGLPATDLAQLVEAAKAAPGRITVGHSGTGGLAHLIGEAFANLAGISVVMVPYRGDGPVAAAALSGEVDLAILSTQAAIPLVQGGQVRPLAVTTAVRAPGLANVPTVAEAGFPGFTAGTLGGLHAPAGTPAPIVERLSAAMRAGVALPRIRDRIIALGSVPVGSDPAQFGTYVRGEQQRWGEIIRRLDLRVEP